MNDLPKLVGWLMNFIANSPTDAEFKPADFETIARDYERGVHPWESSSAIAEGRDPEPPAPATYQGER